MLKLLVLVLAASALAPGSAAWAQKPPATSNQPKPIARADYVKSIDARFNAMDANHDGKISKDELVAQEQRERQQATARINQQLQARFKQLDTNRDGQLSMAEFAAAAGPVRAQESPDQIIQRLDTNRDGKVSVEEFRVPLLGKFSEVDTNRDGIVSPDEIRAASKK